MYGVLNCKQNPVSIEFILSAGGHLMRFVSP